MKPHRPAAEHLECRIAPAALLNVAGNGKSASFTDEDGDKVKVKIVGPGTLDELNFSLLDTTLGAKFVALTLGTEFDGADVSITSEKAGLGGRGDGRVNLTFLDATGVDLGAASIDGDLGKIVLGDTDTADVSLRSLSVFSMGMYDVDLLSTISGSVGKFVVSRDVDGAFVEVIGDSANVGKLKVGGSFLGGTADNSGSFQAEGTISVAKIGGSLIGGDGEDSGSLIGGTNIDVVTIGGGLRGGSMPGSGSVSGGDFLGKITIGRSIRGGDGEGSGSLTSGGRIDSVKIGGDLEGGGGKRSGSIYTVGDDDTGAIGFVKISGDLASGANSLTGIISDATIGTVKVKGEVRGNSGASVKIIAEGLLNPATSFEAQAIRSIKITGSATFLEVLAGYRVEGVASNADVQIGTVAVGGNWRAGSISAGVVANTMGFGDGDDQVFGMGGSATIQSEIGSISIGGEILGVPGGAVSYGFVAENISAFTVNQIAISLINPPGDLADVVPVGTTGDVTIREVKTN